MDLKSLPEVTFAQKDVETILNDMITGYEKAYYEKTGEEITLYDGDPIRIFLYSQALGEFQLRQLIDFSAKQNLLKYAIDDYLDNLGAFQDTPRLEAGHAIVTEQFNLSIATTTIQTIPKGSRVTSNISNGIYFAVTQDINIPIGSTSINATLECLTAGTSGNGFVSGQLNILADPLPWIDSVTNIDTSQGGSDKEDNESYRERIHEAPEGFSVAGPEGAYIFFAKKYSSSISDIKAPSPTPGTVNVLVLLENGEIPTDTFLKGLKDYLSDKTLRPLTDNLQIKAPEVVNFDITLTYYISADDSASAEAIKTNVGKAINEYILWQKSKIGRDINDDELKTRIKSAGAKRSVLTSPNYTVITESQIAIAANVKVIYGGIEDD